MPGDNWHELATIERFRHGYASGDAADLEDALAEDAVWHIPGRSPLAGEYSGREAIVGLVRRMHELTGGTFRVWREDSWDIATGDFHAVLMDRFLAEREDRRLDSHEAFVLHAVGGRIHALFHYIYDQYAWDEFWA